MWNDFIDLKQELTRIFTYYCEGGRPDHYEEYGHYNWYWKSKKLELGHISVVDKRESHGIWMMHVNAYSNCTYPMPIYGFDVVCAKKKVTGCFHDLSPVGYNDMKMIRKEVKRERELPDWAKEIFSGGMLAAGNITERDQCLEYATQGMDNLEAWFLQLETIQMIPPSVKFMNARTKYCHNQLQNPHSFNVMKSLGFDEEYLKEFKTTKQFPF